MTAPGTKCGDKEMRNTCAWMAEDNSPMALGPSRGAEQDQGGSSRLRPQGRHQAWDRLTRAPSRECGGAGAAEGGLRVG